jgi:hypothetical protein
MTIASTTSSDWTLSKGTVTGNDANATVTFSSQSIMLELDSKLDGLYSPNAALTNKPNTNMPTSVTLATGQDAFYQCSTYNGAAYVTAASTGKTPTVIRVVNNKKTEQACTVTVLVVLSSDTTNTRYAAAALTFYFADANKTYNLGYSYADASSKTAVGVSDFADSSKATDVANAKVENPTAVTASNVTGTAPEYATATAAGATSQFKVATTEIKINDNITLAQNQVFLTYSFTTESLTTGSGVNLLNYTWINGWVADDSANTSTITVYYIFGDAPTNIPTTEAPVVGGTVSS